MEYAFYSLSNIGPQEPLLTTSPTAPKLKEYFGIALFGIGRVGTVHFENIIKNPKMKLLYIIDEYEGCGHQLLEKQHLQKACVLHPDDSSICFSDARVDAIIIATPTPSHEKLLRKALQSGKAIFCEAPISPDRYITKICLEEAGRSKLHPPLMCGYNRRFDPTLRELKERISWNEIGKIRTIRCCTRERVLPSTAYLKNSGGLIQDLAIHDIDTVCWLVNELPLTVYAESHAHSKEIIDINDIDSVVIILKFPSGIIGMVETDRNSRHGYDQKVEIFGSEGLLISDNPLSSNITHLKIEGTIRDRIPLSFGYRFSESCAEEMNHFLNVLQKKEELLISPEDVLNISRIALACEISIKSKKIIHLEENDLVQEESKP